MTEYTQGIQDYFKEKCQPQQRFRKRDVVDIILQFNAELFSCADDYTGNVKIHFLFAYEVLDDVLKLNAISSLMTVSTKWSLKI